MKADAEPFDSRHFGALALNALLQAAPSARWRTRRWRGTKDAVRALSLSRAADVNAAQGDGMTALHWAAMKDDAELVQTLLFAGANVRATTRIGSYTPLILAAKSGSSSAIAPLLKSGADANSATSNGRPR
jgi:ankyrin repeat protein